MRPSDRLTFTVVRAALALGAGGCAAAPAAMRIGPAERVTDLAVVAVMPLQHPSLSFLQSRSLTERLAAEVAVRNQRAQVVSPDEVAERLGLSGWLRDWAGFLIAYRDSGIVNHSTVIEVGRLLEVPGIVLLSVFPGGGTTPAVLELSVFECAGGRLEWAGSSLLDPLGDLASEDRVSQLHQRLAELLDSLPPLRQR